MYVTFHFSIFFIFSILSTLSAVPREWVEDCFSENSTLENVDFTSIRWFTLRNRICNEMNASKVQRNSIPHNLEENNIQPFMKELMENSVPLRSLKLVVLGDGQIGKTTLLNSMKLILDPDNHKVNVHFSFNKFIFHPIHRMHPPL